MLFLVVVFVIWMVFWMWLIAHALWVELYGCFE